MNNARLLALNNGVEVPALGLGVLQREGGGGVLGGVDPLTNGCGGGIGVSEATLNHPFSENGSASDLLV